MKLALFAILGLLLGAGGGSAMAVMKAKKAFAAYDVAASGTLRAGT